MQGLVRFDIAALVAFGLYTGYHKATRAYERHKLDVEMAARIDKLPAEQRRMGAISTYLSFFWANERLLPAVCKDNGVELLSYASTFRDRNTQEHDRVRTAFQALGHSEREVIDLMNQDPTPRKLVTATLEKLAHESGKDRSVAQGCIVLANKQDDALDLMDFRNVFPTVWQRMELP